MIGIDTNVLVRFLTQDDPEQAARAAEVMRSLTPIDRGFIPTVVLVEAYWVLTRGYKLSKDEVVATLVDLTTNASIEAQDPDITARALARAADGADLPDALIAEASRRAGCSRVMSFDAAAGESLGFQAP